MLSNAHLLIISAILAIAVSFGYQLYTRWDSDRHRQQILREFDENIQAIQKTLDECGRITGKGRNHAR